MAGESAPANPPPPEPVPGGSSPDPLEGVENEKEIPDKYRAIFLDEAEVTARVASATGGQLAFRRAMLRPAPAVDVVRRLLNNLTRDYTLAGRAADALWTVELKQLLPNRITDDDRVRGRLLETLGRFDEAADAYERYVEEVGAGAGDAEEVRRDAIRSRARLN